MKPVFDYLEAEGVLFVAKHDGVDIFSAMSEAQQNRIKEIIGISCTYKFVFESVNNSNSGQKKLKGEGETQYDVEHHSTISKNISNFDAIPTESPPIIRSRKKIREGIKDKNTLELLVRLDQLFYDTI